MTEVTLIFDIGKTNKKLYLLDNNLNEVHKEYRRFSELKDDDGYPCDDLQGICKWMKDSVQELLKSTAFRIKAINFSTYGASLVHLDKNGEVVAPFYNYFKPFPEDLKRDFFEKYHGEANFSLITASPSMGFLNSGLQLYYLKYKKPDLFKKVKVSLHFPQYLSYIFTRKLTSDFTSVGCHTGLWDFRNQDYAQWVREEGLDKYLPPVESTGTFHRVDMEGRIFNVGIGVHDSSAALVPYNKISLGPFALISTGTWSICMNPFNNRQLTKEELVMDCLSFMSADGQPIKASRLFLGQELADQALKLSKNYKEEFGKYKKVKFDPLFKPLPMREGELFFKYRYLDPKRYGYRSEPGEDLNVFSDFNQAYHQLIHELTDLQICALNLTIGSSKVSDIFIDGGFSDNHVFTQMLANKLPQQMIKSTEFALGSSLGAAVLVRAKEELTKLVVESYKLRIHSPIQKAPSNSNSLIIDPK